MSSKKEKKIGELVQQRLSKYEALTTPPAQNRTLPPGHSYKRSWSYDEKEIKTRNQHITVSERLRENRGVRSTVSVLNFVRKQEPEYVRLQQHILEL